MLDNTEELLQEVKDRWVPRFRGQDYYNNARYDFKSNLQKQKNKTPRGGVRAEMQLLRALP
jgi:hypothetical protein